MIGTHINPAWLAPQDYVNFLNRCFPNSWDLRSFDWYLRRSFAGQTTDIAVRSDGAQLLAMVAVCYRRIIAPDGSKTRVGIMLAGGTLRSERRHGHYSALMQASLDIGRERGCEALLGFVTRQNGSGRGLSRLGAYSVPSFYIASRFPKPSQHAWRRRAHGSGLKQYVAIKLGQTARRDFADDRRHIRFSYDDPADWTEQYLCRPNVVRLCRPSHDSAALLESVGSVDRLQWLDCPEHRTITTIASLAAASDRVARGFFMYTMDPLLAMATKRIGLRVRDGFLKILPVQSSPGDSVKRLATLPWRLQSGDRM